MCKNGVFNTQGYDAKISVYNENGSERYIEASKPKDIRLEAVPHNIALYIQTDIKQVSYPFNLRFNPSIFAQ